MSASAGVVWVRPPSEMQAAIRQYGEEKVMQAVLAVADYVSGLIERDMKKTAPWTDRTGNARGALRSFAERAAKDIVVIYAVHGMSYGVYLELCNGGKYAVLRPVLLKHYETVMRLLQDIFR